MFMNPEMQPRQAKMQPKQPKMQHRDAKMQPKMQRKKQPQNFSQRLHPNLVMVVHDDRVTLGASAHSHVA